MKDVLQRTGGVVFSLLVCAGMFAALAFAQLPTAAILGTVKDSSGAVVPDTSLTARNVATGQARTTISSATGSYRFSALPVGPYEIRAEHQGFQTTVQSGLTLTIGLEAVVNITLQVGAVTETVAVTAEAPLVNTTSGALGALVNEEKVADLPLNGRNYVDLTMMQPGIVQNTNKENQGGGIGTWYVSNGAPPRSNTYLLDGAPMGNAFGGSTSSATGETLGVEGIQEYKVMTNAFSAEYGQTMGSQMTIVSKSGTNNFHGSAFDYLRNSVLDARNFFDYKSAATGPGFRLPPFKRNQFGGAFGGPIKKDKTFFYAVYEGLRDSQGITTISPVPGAGCHGAAGATITNVACPQLGSTSSVVISPVIAPALALYPLPNLGSSQYTFPFNANANENWGQIRVDQNFSSKDLLFGRFTTDVADQPIALQLPAFSYLAHSTIRVLTVAENHTFTPTLLNQARFSYSLTNIFDNNVYTGFSPISAALSFVAGLPIGNWNVGGITGLGGDSASPTEQDDSIFTYSDDLFYTRGRHSLKFGGLVNRRHVTKFSSPSVQGQANFGNMANFLIGKASLLQSVTPGSITIHRWRWYTFGFYAQDDMKVLPNLTLSLGLRYEPYTVPRDADGHESTLRNALLDSSYTVGPIFQNPSKLTFSPRFGFAWDVMGDGKTAVRGGYALLYDQFVHGGVLLPGFSTSDPPFSSRTTVNNPPLLTSLPLEFAAGVKGKSVSPSDYNLKQAHLLSYNLTVERQLPGNMVLSLAYAGSKGLNLWRGLEANMYVPLGVPNATGTACVALPAGSTSHLFTGPYCFTGTEKRPNPNFTNVSMTTADGMSFYNSLQFGLTMRLSHGLQFQSSYTWSKMMDDSQGGQADTPADSLISDQAHPLTDWAPSAFDVTQNWRFNLIYHFPTLAGMKGTGAKLLGGWWISTITSVQTGYPVTPILVSNQSLSGFVHSGVSGDRPNLNPGRNTANIISGTTAGCLGEAPGQKLGTPNLFFDPCAFSLQPLGFLGNAGRNILRLPGLFNIDFSVVKDTSIPKLGEAGKLEIRAEFFNILNHANFGFDVNNPDNLIFGGTSSPTESLNQAVLSNAGVLTHTATSSRQIQLALRLIF
jgi:hypothetical protein